ncbi:hypothetical protein D1007_20183 [Hordeum vulgare]|nr:hypothetical protein D1007_20183 [Hordeum vulgare]
MGAMPSYPYWPSDAEAAASDRSRLSPPALLPRRRPVSSRIPETSVPISSRPSSTLLRIAAPIKCTSSDVDWCCVDVAPIRQRRTMRKVRSSTTAPWMKVATTYNTNPPSPLMVSNVRNAHKLLKGKRTTRVNTSVLQMAVNESLQHESEVKTTTQFGFEVQLSKVYTRAVFVDFKETLYRNTAFGAE